MSNSQHNQGTKPETPDKKAEGDPLATLKSIRDISFFLGIYFLFSGWMYIYYYLDYFGISVREADIDYSQFGIYSYSVIAYYCGQGMFWVWSLGMFVAAIISYILYKKFVKKLLIRITNKISADLRRRISDYKRGIIVSLALCIFFPIVFKMSKNAGIHMAHKKSMMGLDKVKFIFNDGFLKKDSTIVKQAPDNAGEKSHLLDVNKKEKLRLIMANKDRYFVLEHNKCESCVRVVYCVRKEDINNVIIYLEHTSKEL